MKGRTGLACAHASGGAAGCRRSCCSSFCGGFRSQRQAQGGHAGALAQATRLQPLPRALQQVQNYAEAMRPAKATFCVPLHGSRQVPRVWPDQCRKAQGLEASQHRIPEECEGHAIARLSAATQTGFF